MKKHIAMMACAASVALADPSNSVLLGLGTNGLGVGYRYNAAEYFALRTDLSGLGFTISADDDSPELKYEAKFKFLNLGLYADLFPFGNGMFISGGAMIGKNEITATGKTTRKTQIQIGKHNYFYGADEFIEMKVKLPKFRPYVGVGYANKNSSGFGFTTNLGLAFGKTTVEARSSENLNRFLEFQQDLEKERKELEDDFSFVKFYPVINFNLTYSF